MLTLLACALAALLPQEPVPQEKAAPADALQQALLRAGENRAQLEQALAEVPAAERPAMAFLIEHMPDQDLRTLGAEFLLADVALAHAARAAAPWQVPDDVFLDWVLPYAQIDETREAWRADLRARCLPLVQGCTTPGAAAMALNEKLFPLLGVKYSTKRRKANQSPSESIEQGLASCTGLSILLADACRSVGVPARLCGIGSWPGSGGNHTWVEVWDGQRWRFLGAAEPDPQGLDRAWFAERAQTAVPGDPREGIFAACWRRTGARFPLPWRGGFAVPGVEVTGRYAQDAAAGSGDAALLAQMQRFYLAGEAERADFAFDRNLDAELLTAAGDARLRALAFRAFVTLPHADLREDHAAGRVRAGGKESPFTVKQVGEKPAGGWALVIAMHGGGGVPKRVNDQQWRHMQIYYRDQPQAGGYLYCALRAPTDEWNGFYTDYAYPVIERLIRQFVVCAEVDPDKVFAIGYSHGGYGAFAIGPKLPDRFAAVHASASAPTDGETSPVGLHSLPFTFMVGGKDTAYGRAERCQRFEGLLQDLQKSHPGQYPFAFRLVADNGHTGLPDRDLLAELLPKTRVAMPKDLHWELTDPVVDHHYWLRADAPGKGQRVDARLLGQTLTVQLTGRTAVTALLDARLVDLRQPVMLRIGESTQELRLQPSLRVLCAGVLASGDPTLAGSVIVTAMNP